MNLKGYKKQKPVKKSLLKLKKAITDLDKDINVMKARGLTNEEIKTSLKQMKYLNNPELTEVKERAISLL